MKLDPGGGVSMTPIRVLVADDIANTREDIKRLLVF
jgi:hypothetical protein